MKKIAALVGCLAVAGAVATAPAASGEAFDDYLTDVSNTVNVTANNMEEMLIVGLAVCVDLLTGISITQEYRDLIDYGVSSDQAGNIIESSVIHLCPQVGRGGLS